MKTPQVPAGTAESGLGPRPGVPQRPAQLSKAQGRVLDVLRAEPAPVTLTALSALTGLHPNTLREHLDALEGSGLVRRWHADPTGPGRPPTLVEAADLAGTTGHSEYAGLAAALASTLHRTSDDPRRDAALAGAQWGHELAAARRRPAPRGSAGARREVVAMLDEIGFAPEASRDASVVRLTRCPLLEAAQKYPDVVCAVHLGIARGALEEHGADPAPVELFPFSEPGACRLHLGGGRTPGSGR